MPILARRGEAARLAETGRERNAVNRPWRFAIGAVAIFNIAIGLGFLLDPAGSALRFHLVPLGTQGMATLRADFPAFFIVVGGGALFAAVRGIRAPLLVPIALLGVAFAGRVVSLVADGAPPTAFPPMVAEAVMIALLGLAFRSARA
jgi:hypothetical protein